MPVKLRRSKRRGGTPEAELEAWAMLFESGYDYLGSIAPERWHPYWNKPIPRDVIAAKWTWLGEAFLARRAQLIGHADGDPWALREFGQPCR